MHKKYIDKSNKSMVIAMKYDVTIIGGGATGTSIFRDLSLRNFKVALLERNKIASGTTSASHQNLVSGMRYVLKDPIVAKECADENRILSKIAPDIVGKLSNYFVGFSDDYTEQALKEARRLGIPFTETDMKEVLKEIPALSSNLEIAIETADKNINARKFCWLNCQSAISNGGNLLEKIQIRNISNGNRYILETTDGRIETDYVINATGAWVNTIAGLAGVKIPLLYSQGTIVVLKTQSPRGIQYFHTPGDADAYIVHNSRAWLGTTSTTIDNPDDARPEPWADEYLQNKFSIVLPSLRRQKVLNRFVGVRPLIKNINEAENGRALSRDFNIAEEPEDFFHVVGGKLTTARLMAQHTSDLLCEKAGVNSRCMTDKEPLL